MILPTYEVGVASSISTRINLKMAYNGSGLPFHGSSTHRPCLRAKLAACEPIVCCVPGVLTQLEKPKPN